MKRSHVEEFKAFCWHCWSAGITSFHINRENNLIRMSCALIPAFIPLTTFFSTEYYFFNRHVLASFHPTDTCCNQLCHNSACMWKNSAHYYQNTFEIEFIAHLKINIKCHDTHFSPVKRNKNKNKSLQNSHTFSVISTNFHFPTKRPWICRNASLKLHSFIKTQKKKH